MKHSIPTDKIVHGDCEKILKKFPDNCVDLIITSPPYADNRKKSYDGIHPDKYVDWLIPKTEQFLRVLKSSGTFVLNIKERVISGERHIYVLELILRMRKQKLKIIEIPVEWKEPTDRLPKFNLLTDGIKMGYDLIKLRTKILTNEH